MVAEKGLFMIGVVYVAFCVGTYLKFREYGIDKKRMILSCIIPAGLILFCLLAPVRFLMNKKEYSLGTRLCMIPFLIYKSVKSFPVLVGITANILVGITESRCTPKTSVHVVSVSSFKSFFWPKVERYYDDVTVVRFGRA